MRLKTDEINSILRGLAEVSELSDPYELYLFGSRADDEKLGGDIDLLLVVPASQLQKTASIKHRLVTGAKKYIDDQRIDLVLRAKESLDSDPFYKTITSTLIRLR